MHTVIIEVWVNFIVIEDATFASQNIHAQC